MIKENIISIINSHYRIVEDTEIMTRAIVNKHSLVFYKETHRYVIDGKEVPSVSQIVKEINPNPYKDIKKEILDKASVRGDTFHEEVFKYETTGEEGGSEEFAGYLELKQMYQFSSLANEIFIVLTDINNRAIGAGRLDMIALDGDLLGLCELKTTSRLHKQNVALQLNLYKIGFESSYELNIDELICLRCRRELAEFIDVPTNEEQALDAIDYYIKKKV